MNSKPQETNIERTWLEENFKTDLENENIACDTSQRSQGEVELRGLYEQTTRTDICFQFLEINILFNVPFANFATLLFRSGISAPCF